MLNPINARTVDHSSKHPLGALLNFLCCTQPFRLLRLYINNKDNCNPSSSLGNPLVNPCVIDAFALVDGTYSSKENAVSRIFLRTTQSIAQASLSLASAVAT